MGNVMRNSQRSFKLGSILFRLPDWFINFIFNRFTKPFSLEMLLLVGPYAHNLLVYLVLLPVQIVAIPGKITLPRYTFKPFFNHHFCIFFSRSKMNICFSQPLPWMFFLFTYYSRITSYPIPHPNMTQITMYIIYFSRINNYQCTAWFQNSPNFAESPSLLSYQSLNRKECTNSIKSIIFKW